jgi:hypothetical protein
MLREWKQGEELGAGRLNEVNRAAEAAQLGVASGSRLELRRSSAGTTLSRKRRLEMWVKVTGGGTAGAYDGIQQIEADASGGWDDGPKTFAEADGDLREIGAATDVPIDGSAIVRATKDRFCWRFAYGAC